MGFWPITLTSSSVAAGTVMCISLVGEPLKPQFILTSYVLLFVKGIKEQIEYDRFLSAVHFCLRAV